MTDIPEDIRTAAVEAWGHASVLSISANQIVIIADALLSEREATEARTIERCAKVAETMPLEILHFYPRPGGPPGNQKRQTTFADVAAAIRSQGKESPKEMDAGDKATLRDLIPKTYKIEQ